VTQIIAGVDVSSSTLDARVGRDGVEESFKNNVEGAENLILFCQEHEVELVVMEATGGYEKAVFCQLWQAGVPAAIVNPRSVRWFAEAMGCFEKTDRIDAGLIAWYAQVKRIVAQEPAKETQEQLAALVTRLRQVTEMRASQLNQKRLVRDAEVLASFQELISLLTRQIRVLEDKVAKLIEQDPLWAKMDEAFRTIKGVADRTVARLMAEMPEIGTISHKAISKLSGVAPMARDSGNLKGKRAIRGGRANVRSILYVVADIVRRYDADFAEFHKRMLAAGKPRKVVRIALAHKLLVRLNAKARDVRQNFLPAA